ncbi:MAG: anaerobic ribonucleoside-triphosphate reductase activating protein [Selenomonadaceae bacterium]|nr:anaerobic ribonucleoside-triphosphate reductase activating protein [Selenomonadaceae bacterium]
MTLKVRIAGLEEESYVDGEGIRYAIFVQGCPHHCEGCHNPQTFDFDGGRLIEIDELLDRIKGNALLSGVTLTGGEPLCQLRSLTELARAVQGMGLTVWCYTGFTFEELIGGVERYFSADEVREFLRHVDVLVDGPFVEARRDLSLAFRGSGNQRLIDVPKTLSGHEIVLLDLD